MLKFMMFAFILEEALGGGGGSNMLCSLLIILNNIFFKHGPSTYLNFDRKFDIQTKTKSL